MLKVITHALVYIIFRSIMSMILNDYNYDLIVCDG